MPCRSDYMEQNNSERRFQETAKLLVYAWDWNTLGGPLPTKFRNEADTIYAKNVGQVEALCELIRSVRNRSPAMFNKMVYNGHDPMSRRLADWWEEHEAEDRKREAAETQYAKDKARFFVLTLNMSEDDKRILKENLR